MVSVVRKDSGDLDTAHLSYSRAVEGLRRAGNYSDVLGCSITLADLRVTQGRLDDAVTTYEDALRLASEHGAGDALRGTADMVVGLGLVALERGDLAEAATQLRRADRLGEHNGLPQHPYRWRVARARLLQAQGDPAAALVLLEEADRVYVGDFSPDVRPVPAQRARVLLELGRLSEALDWARERQLDAADELHYVREFEHVTLARILLHQNSINHSSPALHRAADLLGRLHRAAEEGGRNGTLVEVLVLEALVHHARHDLPGGLRVLERAVRLAQATGQVRVFADTGGPVVTMLEMLARQDPTWGHPRLLLDALRPPAAPDGPAILPATVPATVPATQGLVDPLSPRELEVLRLLATDLDGPAIARELVVSLNTVRTHTKNIYAKLGVNSRLTAVTRARELDLLVRHR